MRRTALKRTAGLTGAPLKPWRPKHRSRTEQARHDAWVEAVLAKPCVLPRVEGELIDPHHVITQQHLRERGLHDLVWGDPRNGMPVPRSIHANHTAASERIPLWAVPAEAVEFACELGLGWMLDKYYAPSSDSEAA